MEIPLRVLFVAVIGSILSSCGGSPTYDGRDVSGLARAAFSVKTKVVQIGAGTYSVNVRGDALTYLGDGPDQLKKVALLQSAEVALERFRLYFVILNRIDHYTADGSASHPYDHYTLDGSASHPYTTLTIEIFDEKPVNRGTVYDACEVVDTLKPPWRGTPNVEVSAHWCNRLDWVIAARARGKH